MGIKKKAGVTKSFGQNNDKYCGKILSFNTAGSKTSLHFHKERDKTWFINAGQFKVRFIDTQTTEIKEAVLKEGDVFQVPALQPHQLEALTNGAMIFEVSTTYTVEDNYRVAAGDSQVNKVEQNGKSDV